MANWRAKPEIANREFWTAIWLFEINVCAVCSVHTVYIRCRCHGRCHHRRRHTSIYVVFVVFYACVYVCMHACVPQLKDYGFNNESVVIVALSRIDIDVKCSCSQWNIWKLCTFIYMLACSFLGRQFISLCTTSVTGKTPTNTTKWEKTQENKHQATTISIFGVSVFFCFVVSAGPLRQKIPWELGTVIHFKQ